MAFALAWPMPSKVANVSCVLPRLRHRAAAYMSVPSVASPPGETLKLSA
jgi:hypothetical protein